MTTATVDAEPVAQPGPQRSGAGVGIDRQQREFGPADVGPVHAGGGLNQPEPVLGDQGPALARQHAHRLVVDQLAPQLVALLGVFGRRHQPALALGHHLAGDHHDVAVAQPRCGGGDGSAQVVAGPEFGKPGDGQDLDRRGGAVLDRRRIRSRRHARKLQPGADHLGGRLRVGHQQRHRPHRDPVDVGVGRPRAPASSPVSRCRGAPRSAGRPPRRWTPPRSPTGIYRPCRATAFRR